MTEADDAPDAAADDGWTPCPLCGARIRADAIKCRHCGEFLDEPRATRRPREAAPRPGGGGGRRTVIIVLSVVGGCLLLGVLVLALFGALGYTAQRAMNSALQRANALRNLRQVELSLLRYHADTGALPTQLQDLVTAPTGVAGWNGPYSSVGLSRDPWRNALVYSASADGSYKLTSYGADGKPGGAGDDADVVISGGVGP